MDHFELVAPFRAAGRFISLCRRALYPRRTVIVFSVLFAKSLGVEVNHELFKANSSYVRNALVWVSQGIYSKYEYLERIFFDAILNEDILMSFIQSNFVI